MQTLGVKKEYYGMLWYFLEWSITPGFKPFTLTSYLGEMLGQGMGRWLFTVAKGKQANPKTKDLRKYFLWSNRQFPISKNSHFQNKSKCKTFLSENEYYLHENEGL